MYSESRPSPVLARIDPRNLFQPETDVRAVRGACQSPTRLGAHRIKIIAKPPEVAEDDASKRDRDGPNVNPVEGENGKSEGEVQGRCELILAGKGAEARVFLDVEPFFVVRGLPLQHPHKQAGR